jgi:hypothetical protein
LPTLEAPSDKNVKSRASGSDVGCASSNTMVCGSPVRTRMLAMGDCGSTGVAKRRRGSAYSRNSRKRPSLITRTFSFVSRIVTLGKIFIQTSSSMSKSGSMPSVSSAVGQRTCKCDDGPSRAVMCPSAEAVTSPRAVGNSGVGAPGGAVTSRTDVSRTGIARSKPVEVPNACKLGSSRSSAR